jgi:hypothetical protein
MQASSISKLTTKGEILAMNYKGMATMASQFSFTSNVHNVFLLRKMDIYHERKNKEILKHLKISK